MTEIRKVREVSGSIVVTLPTEVREAAGIEKDDHATFTVEDDEVILTTVDA
jgi:bifunctional DNA-binding transcriptional regulator/antitoxin component of YhaV-PrlF toxin-antitoxin module